jgi:hypothetical protein
VHTVTQLQTFRLFHRDEVPAFLREEHIVAHYRVFFSPRLCFESLVRLHNGCAAGANARADASAAQKR